jgi:eukaryotic-like serine/threonine-protein kinase
VLLLVVAAVAGGTSSAPEIPENTPEQLRGPLEDLHVAVEGDGE